MIPATTGSATPATESLSRRLVAAGAVGLILPVLLVGASFVLMSYGEENGRCGHFGCAQVLIWLWEPGRWLAVAAGWPLLRLFHVRPAWRVTVVAAFFLVALWEFAWAYFDDSVGLVLLSGLLTYPSAAVATDPRVSGFRRAVIVLPYLAALVVAALLG
ncbi:hypothetical protein HII36_08505 [Nonomuraea sp. NN258]|uniref:hypothetical protein n=1 Tax=Nonomuraea antri TaxID=2730852 RepID=UPI001568CAD1|nr:hypothetical protein [Nonomuraea antri]NRQ31879.1 hypothetical protein [Nonomuraea antri]